LGKTVGNNKIYYNLPFLLKLLQTFKIIFGLASPDQMGRATRNEGGRWDL